MSRGVKVRIMAFLVLSAVGISLAAYLVGKFIGGGKSTLIAGVLGGMVSSTATTAGVSRRSKAEGSAGISLAAITLIAS